MFVYVDCVLIFAMKEFGSRSFWSIRKRECGLSLSTAWKTAVGKILRKGVRLSLISMCSIALYVNVTAAFSVHFIVTRIIIFSSREP